MKLLSCLYTSYGSLGQYFISGSIIDANPPPYVVSQSPASTGNVVGPLSQIAVTFSEAMNPASFAIADDVVSFTGPAGTNLYASISSAVWSSGNQTLLRSREDSVEITDLGKTYSITETIPPGEISEIAVSYFVSGNYHYKESDRTPLSRGSHIKTRQKLAFGMPVTLRVSDADTGEIVHEQKEHVGYKSAEKPAPEKTIFNMEHGKKHFQIPAIPNATKLKFDLTIKKDDGYDFTFKGASFAVVENAAVGFFDWGTGVRLIIAGATGVFFAMILIFLGFLVGRKVASS